MSPGLFFVLLNEDHEGPAIGPLEEVTISEISGYTLTFVENTFQETVDRLAAVAGWETKDVLKMSTQPTDDFIEYNSENFISWELQYYTADEAFEHNTRYAENKRSRNKTLH